MHIPNGFLSDPVCALTTLTSAGAIGYAVASCRGESNGRSAATMAATGAGIFAAQMVNFPVDGGTSGHVIGAALAAIVLGPWRGMVTMAAVLAVQCFVFGDGGIATLGANLLNMAVIGTLVAWSLYAFTTRRVSGANGRLLGTGVAAFGSLIAAAAFCAVELAASGTYEFSQVFTAMMQVHLTIALGEAAMTVAIVAAGLAVLRDKPMLSTRSIAIGGLTLAVVIAGLLAPVASIRPDGLERVAEDLNFAQLATSSWSLAPDYAAPGIVWPALAVAIAGIGGVLLVFAATYTLGRTAKARVRRH